MDRIPISYQEIMEYFISQSMAGKVNPYNLRSKTITHIEQVTQRPLLCYVTRTDSMMQRIDVPNYINDDDLLTFQDFISENNKYEMDILIISNGGSAESAERIVNLLRSRFRSIRWIVPFNAYSAATLLCLSGDAIIMGPAGTLGPVDPQINGIPARAILRAFEEVRERLKIEGPAALTAYMPLLAKYDLHLLEICKSALELSQELVRKWLSQYMFHCDQNDDRVIQCVEFFSSFDIHKSHGRSIDRKTARDKGLVVTFDEEIVGLPNLLRSLSNQYKWFFDNFPVVKIVENGHGKSTAILLEMQQSSPLTSTPENMRGIPPTSSENLP
jgi:hypothetical protein